MVKYLDFARLVGAGIRCSVCNGTRCRQSRWDSKHEKLSNTGSKPYRCEDCENRFFAASSASLERTLINTIAYVILGIAALTPIELWLGSNDNQTAGPVELLSAVNTEEGTTRNQQGGGHPGEFAKETPDVKRLSDDQEDNVTQLRKAASKGQVGAMIRLGQILATGIEQPKDTKQAAKWIQLAAATGNADGMFELGRYYRDGVGLQQNYARAYVWLSRAAAANHLSAMHERDDLVRKMSAEELGEAQNLASSEDWRGNNGPLRQ